VPRPSASDHRLCRNSARLLPNSDVLWTDRSIELTAVLSAIVIIECAEQLSSGGNKGVQGLRYPSPNFAKSSKELPETDKNTLGVLST